MLNYILESIVFSILYDHWLLVIDILILVVGVYWFNTTYCVFGFKISTIIISKTVVSWFVWDISLSVHILTTVLGNETISDNFWSKLCTFVAFFSIN